MGREERGALVPVSPFDVRPTPLFSLGGGLLFDEVQDKCDCWVFGSAEGASRPSVIGMSPPAQIGPRNNGPDTLVCCG